MLGALLQHLAPQRRDLLLDIALRGGELLEGLALGQRDPARLLGGLGVGAGRGLEVGGGLPAPTGTLGDGHDLAPEHRGGR